jgi:hypothetical protein
MKKMLAAALCLSLGFLAISNDAAADNTSPAPQQAPQQVQRVQPGGFVITSIKGDITVPAPPTFTSSGYGDAKTMSGIKCSNLVVVATSVAKKPRPAGYEGFWMDPPVWTRNIAATGTWSSGHCSYSVGVVPGSAFTLSASVPPVAPFKCTDTNVSTGGLPASEVVPSGTSKTENFAVTKVNCNVVG